MGRLTADFAKAFSRDLKKNAKRRNWNLTELEKVIDLVVENTPETLEELRRRGHHLFRLRRMRDQSDCHHLSLLRYFCQRRNDRHGLRHA